jgi:xanthine dehydrogenase accessory factor
MTGWLEDIATVAADHERCVIVTVAGVRGSAPRETGAKMLVTAKETIGTIGGGELEYQCTRIAVERLQERAGPGGDRTRRRFPLGTNCGQCCGGVVDVVFERVALRETGWLTELRRLHDERCPVVMMTPVDTAAGRQLLTAETCMSFDGAPDLPSSVDAAARRLLDEPGEASVLDGFLLEPVMPTAFRIAVFGAGHVGAATVGVLANLDCDIRWIDSRRGMFPPVLPGNVTAVESVDPAREVAAMPAGSYFLVITHSHPLDFEICSQVLQRGDFAYCGLIGSLAKRRRFERRLTKQGVPEAMLDRLTCPIGVSGIAGKKPADIGIAAAAEILQTRDAGLAAKEDNAHSKNSNVRAL